MIRAFVFTYHPQTPVTQIAERGVESSAASALVAQALLPVRVRRAGSTFFGVIGEISRPL
jgi:hypothetical protein